jgi:hypothetical protein
MKKSSTIFSCAGFVLLVAAIVSDANAIPSFARKYKTSCATCHVAPPLLNAFGEAFRRNGYQFPQGTDAEFVKDEPVSMGAEGNKKAFPDAIWPGAISGTSPVSLLANLEVPYSKSGGLDFSSLNGEWEVISGGTLGENISFFGNLSFVKDAFEVERLFFTFSSLFGPPLAFNVKVGNFEPNVFSVTDFRSLGHEYWITSQKTVGANAWALEGTQSGIEVNGILGAGRLGYNIGLVEGRENILNKSKDVYAHADYKIGGLRSDGVTEDGKGIDKQHPWEDNSVKLGGFIYKGVAKLSDTQTDNFTKIGGDINASHGRLNGVVGFAVQNDKKPFLVDSSKTGKGTSMFLEGRYVIYPWFIPTVRYEYFKGHNADAVSEKASRILIVPSFLIRANVKLALIGEFAKDPGAKMKFNQLTATLFFGM